MPEIFINLSKMRTESSRLNIFVEYKFVYYRKYLEQYNDGHN